MSASYKRLLERLTLRLADLRILRDVRTELVEPRQGEIACRLLHVAHRDRPTLGVVGVEQRLAAPTLHRGGELPRQVHGIAQPRIHAESAGRVVLVRGVAGDEGAALAEIVGHQLAAFPVRSVEQLELEIAPDRAAQQLADVPLRLVLRRRLHGEAPQPAPVDRGDHAPHAGRIDQMGEAGIAQLRFEDIDQLGRVEEDVPIVLHMRETLELDAEDLAYRRVRPIRTDEVGGGDRFRLAGHLVGDPGLDAVIGLAERFELGAMAQRHGRQRARVAQQDRVEPVLRDQAIRGRREEARVLLPERRKVEPRDLVPGHRRNPDHVRPEIVRMAFLAHAIGQPPAAHEFHRAHVDEVHLGLVDGAVARLDQRAGDTEPPELDGQGETHRSAAGDQDRRVLALCARDVRHGSSLVRFQDGEQASPVQTTKERNQPIGFRLPR